MKTYIFIAIIIVFLFIASTSQSQSDTTGSPGNGSTSNYNISPAIVNKVNTFSSYVTTEANSFNIPESRIKAHIAVESAGNPNAKGSAGEVGLMQLKPGALSDVNKKYLSSAPLTLDDLWQPNYAIAAGTAYLKILYDQLGDLDDASAAYQGGAGNYGSPAAQTYLSKILTAEKLF
jgi:soluble lytic murein transglycosylase-like protein